MSGEHVRTRFIQPVHACERMREGGREGEKQGVIKARSDKLIILQRHYCIDLLTYTHNR